MNCSLKTEGGKALSLLYQVQSYELCTLLKSQMRKKIMSREGMNFFAATFFILYVVGVKRMRMIRRM